MNDTERRKWVDNDEGLYRLSKLHEGSVSDFIKKNRIFIDSVAAQVKSGGRAAHYLLYG